MEMMDKCEAREKNSQSVPCIRANDHFGRTRPRSAGLLTPTDRSATRRIFMISQLAGGSVNGSWQTVREELRRLFMQLYVSGYPVTHFFVIVLYAV